MWYLYFSGERRWKVACSRRDRMRPGILCGGVPGIVGGVELQGFSACYREASQKSEKINEFDTCLTEQ